MGGFAVICFLVGGWLVGWSGSNNESCDRLDDCIICKQIKRMSDVREERKRYT